MTKPSTAVVWGTICRLPDEVRDRVLERACILMSERVVATWPEADALALELETRAVKRKR